jgi:hypothetical protein
MPATTLNKTPRGIRIYMMTRRGLGGGQSDRQKQIEKLKSLRKRREPSDLQKRICGARRFLTSTRECEKKKVIDDKNNAKRRRSNAKKFWHRNSREKRNESAQLR